MRANEKPFTVLGLETSCDETAAAVVRGHPPGPGEILSNVVLGQNEAHRPYGGVVPEIAARAHVELIDGVVARALGEAGLDLSDVDAVAATAGPGLIGGVMVGLVSGKGAGAGGRKTAHRRQSSRGPCAFGAVVGGCGISVFAAFDLRRPLSVDGGRG